MKTGKYITTVPKLLGTAEKNATTVCLDTDGNSNSHIVIFPLYGARGDTEVVGSEDYAKLCFFKSLRREPRMYLHSSIPHEPPPLSIRAAKDDGKPKEKQKKLREVNSSFQCTCWTLSLYEIYVPGESTAHLVCCGGSRGTSRSTFMLSVTFLSLSSPILAAVSLVLLSHQYVQRATTT